MIQRKITTALVLAVVATISLAVPAAAMLVDDSIHADHPDDTEVQVDVSMSDTVNNHPINISRDGTVLKSQTISGVSGDTAKLTFDLTGLSAGDFNLTATDHENATVDSTSITVTKTDVLNATKGETVEADVGFQADETASATVSFNQDTSTNTSSLSFDPIEAEGGEEVQTAEYVAEENGTVDVTIEVTKAHVYDGAWISMQDTDDDAGTAAAELDGDSPLDHPLAPYAVALVLVFAAYAYFKDTNRSNNHGGRDGF